MKGILVLPGGDVEIEGELYNYVRSLNEENSRLMREVSSLKLEIFELKYKPKVSFFNWIFGS